MRESFVFYASFLEAIEELDDKNQLKLYKAISNFAINDVEPDDLKGIAKAIFTLIKPQISASNKRYDNSKKCGEFGKLGGRPKKEKTLKGLEKETLNYNYNDNVNYNLNDNVIALKNPPPTKKEIEEYCKLNAKTIDIDEFIKYYDASSWLDKSGLPVNWKQKVLTFARNYKPKEKEDAYNPCL